MADALCGPSNPLQSFQKHASVDRTLQRDRILSRQSPSQGFRTPNPNASIVEAEYEAFVAGKPILEPFDPQHTWQNHHSPATFAENTRQKAPDWALDFQNLHVNEPRASPIPSTQFRQQAPMQRSSPGAWQQEFMQTHQPQGYQHQNPRLGYANTGYSMNARQSGPLDHVYSTPTAAQHSESQTKESFDEEAFENAFSQANLELQNTTDANATFTPSKPPEAKSIPNDRIDYRIGSDKILDESLNRREEKSDTRAADDELAKTAGLLLENVKHDQSTKFQESNFLSLMRQLRDKEAKVEGDHIVSVRRTFNSKHLHCGLTTPVGRAAASPRRSRLSERPAGKRGSRTASADNRPNASVFSASSAS
ncbi:MAG: hypothetical protein LQ345_002799 [Seirophora villosa]|nr:MAG: hypothetical protein LQ345_002799 [Seirophora villosa]